MMIEKKFDKVYKKFKLNFYDNILNSDSCKKANLTAAEAFCAELIDVLDNPTIGDLVKYIKVAQPNVTYRVNSLVSKGYVTKVNSEIDKRIVILHVTEKYREYQQLKASFAREVVRNTVLTLDEEEREIFEKILDTIDEKMVLSQKNQKIENQLS